jgi:hypothetical protein
MQWTVQDQYAPTRIVETEALLELKEYLTNSKSKYKVTLDHGMWGYVDMCNHVKDTTKKEDTRPFAEPRNVEVTIVFVLPNTLAEKIATMKLSITKDRVGYSYEPWSVSKLTEDIPYTCGVYKRPGFDAVYQAIHVMKPNLTEIEFAQFQSFITPKSDDKTSLWNSTKSKWDLELVEHRLFDGMTDCLKVYIHDETIELGKSRVTLKLLAIDIAPNLEYLKQILVSAQL